MDSSKKLPSKEAALFRNVIKFYELKQYKKGIKAADAILKVFPDHGETLAMKGLTLSCMDQKEEGVELVRKGLRKDPRSNVCWHVYGLLYRADHNYVEAIKCYRNALRADKENLQVLRDLSFLQIQMRDTKGYAETRRQILALRPSNKSHWLAYAAACHMGGDMKTSTRVLQAYADSLTDEDPTRAPYERSELILYRTMILVEGGDIAGALEIVENNKDVIVDGLALREERARLLHLLGRLSEAETEYRSLLEINCECHEYHAHFRKVLEEQWGGPDPEKMIGVYDELEKAFPHSLAPKRLLLDFSKGDAFRTRADRYVRALLHKGVPSLFMDIRPLYNDEEKVSILERLFLDYASSLQSNMAFPPLEGVEAVKETPDTYMWVLFLLAQHFDCIHEQERALAYIDEALRHTPTVLELYSTKALLLKHCGDYEGAAKIAEEGRLLDLADRFINTEAAYFALRADMVDRGEQTAVIFTKDGGGGEQSSNLFDAQCIWYETRTGESYLRTGQYGKALKMFLRVDKHFMEFVEDQLDFHTYCLRRGTLRAYISFLRMEDRLFGHKYYRRAAKGIVKCYLCLFDNPFSKGETAEERELASMDEKERKKILKKRRKEMLKKQAAAAESKEGQTSTDSKGKKRAAEVDTDPDGEELVKNCDPLQEATKFVRKLQAFSGAFLDTHTLAFDLNKRKKKPLLCLQSLKRAHSLAPDDPEVHTRVVSFFHSVESEAEEAFAPAVWQVLRSERQTLLGQQTLRDANEAFLSTHPHSFGALLSAAECMLLLDPNSKDRVISLLSDAPSKSAAGHRLLKLCIRAHIFLESVVNNAEAAQAFKQRCHEVFSCSTYFHI